AQSISGRSHRKMYTMPLSLRFRDWRRVCAADTTPEILPTSGRKERDAWPNKCTRRSVRGSFGSWIAMRHSETSTSFAVDDSQAARQGVPETDLDRMDHNPNPSCTISRTWHHFSARLELRLKGPDITRQRARRDMYTLW